MRRGDLVTVEDSENATHAMISRDDGKSWEKIPIFGEPGRFRISYERALVCTREGTVIVSFMNLAERSGWAWDAAIHDSPLAKLPNYVVRSHDGGRTWETPQKMHDDWTGAIDCDVHPRVPNIAALRRYMDSYWSEAVEVRVVVRRELGDHLLELAQHDLLGHAETGLDHGAHRVPPGEVREVRRGEERVVDVEQDGAQRSHRQGLRWRD